MDSDHVFVDDDGIARSISETPPTHYRVKIKSFSLLIENEVDKYESGEFEVGGYKWKLILYPNGNNSKNVEDHISLYLAFANTSSLGLDWEIPAVFRFFLLDQNKGSYLTVEDAMEKERRYREFKLEWGFDEFISIKEFNDPSNGYLVEDTCVFGVDVFVKKENIGRGECLSMVKKSLTFKKIWKIEKFSKLDSECHYSDVFTAGDAEWMIKLQPEEEFSVNNGGYLSLALCLANPTQCCKIYANFALGIRDQRHQKHKVSKGTKWFDASNTYWGWGRFMSLGELNESGNGYLVKDVCIVEAEVKILGIASEL